MSLARRLLRRPSVPLRVGAPVELLDVLREGPAPVVRFAGGESLRVAVVVPQFRRGSGGHATIANLVRGLEARGHVCSVWVLDEEGRHAGETSEETAALFREFFGPVEGAIHKGFAAWDGADVAVATGWQTVPAVLRRPRVAGRAYLVQDHEPEFYGTSAERLWAEWSYGQGLHCIAASPWLAALVRERYGAAASSFDLAVDHERYRSTGRARRDDRVVFYARAVTARRAVPMGLLALEEVHRRRPDVEIALFGEARDVATAFPATQLGVLEPAQLAAEYARSAVGMVLSLTNPSLIPLEMLACGLPCVEAASDGMVASFGADAPFTLAPLDPLALADGVVGLLDDAELRARRSSDGVAWVAGRTWAAAAEQVEAGLRAALVR